MIPPHFTITSDHQPRAGIILTATCPRGSYPPYAYLWIAFADTHYYAKITQFLDQKCIVPGKESK